MIQLCKHRGEQIASVVSGCHACNGQPIYHCNLHSKRCAIPQRAAEESASKCCETCPDRMAEYREIYCGFLKRGHCEAASRMAGIPLTRCETDNESCQLCQNQTPTPSLQSPTEIMIQIATEGAKRYDNKLVGHLLQSGSRPATNTTARG